MEIKDRIKASRLQQANISDDRGQLQSDLGLGLYSPEEVDQATVYTRQDVSMIVSYLDSQSERQQKILNRLNILVGLGIAALALIALG